MSYETQHVVLYGPNGHPLPVRVSASIDPWVLTIPAILTALVFVTAGLAIAIGAGVVGWSFWWVLLPGTPAGLAVLAVALKLLRRALNYALN